MSMRGDDIGGFWNTGIWVGLRIYALPALVLAGAMAMKDPEKIGLPQVAQTQMSTALAQIDTQFSALNRALGSRGGSARSIFTPNPGAKWVRP